MNADGSGQTLLASVGDLFAFPFGRSLAWSPDGNRIAFTSRPGGDNEIYVMNADGSGQINLTNNPAEDSDPAWSPIP